jgi:UPF0176 protein
MITVAALYHFSRFDDPEALRPALIALCEASDIRGTLLVAPEGINGTIAGPAQGIAAVIDHIQSLPGCAGLEWKESFTETMPFKRMKVRLKREIVTMGQPDVDPLIAVGNYIDPEDWNDLILDPDVVVIDTRNDYEVELGTFANAVDPKTKAFGEFPEWWDKNKAALEGKKIAMFCTGGIRCEKSTNYLLGQGVEDVFHLKGGILKYLEDVPEDASLWEGECYVFDQRVSVTHGLKQGSYQLCHACGGPVSDAAMLDPRYELGVSCPVCIDTYTDEDRARFRTRQLQAEMRSKQKS